PPDAGIEVIEMIDQRRRLTSPVLRREREVSRKPLRRECRNVRRPVVTTLVGLLPFSAPRLRVRKHPAFPAPSVFRGTKMMHSSGALCRENADARHCEERSDEAIHAAACGKMDCFASLAMTRWPFENRTERTFSCPDAAQRALRGALLIRGPQVVNMMGPGSASRHFMPRRVRDTRGGIAGAASSRRWR